MTSWMSAAPFAPNEKSCTKEGLLDLASILNRKAAQIDGQLEPETADTLRQHMAVINSYYSNLIEGNRTLPHQIREAQRGNFEDNPVARDKQIESLAHIDVQAWIASEDRSLEEVISVDFIKELHRRFYRDLPGDLKKVELDEMGEVAWIEGGKFRDRGVKVGRHIPPDAVQQGQTDGRGPLSELGLAHFCHFVLDTSVDQVNYISELLNLKSMKRRIEDFVASRDDLKPASTWVLYQAFIQGSISRSDALALTGEREERTARRLLKKLRDLGLLVDTDPKDSRSPLLWSVPEHAEPVYFPKLSPQ